MKNTLEKQRFSIDLGVKGGHGDVISKFPRISLVHSRKCAVVLTFVFCIIVIPLIFLFPYQVKVSIWNSEPWNI